MPMLYSTEYRSDPSCFSWIYLLDTPMPHEPHVNVLIQKSFARDGQRFKYLEFTALLRAKLKTLPEISLLLFTAYVFLNYILDTIYFCHL